MKRTTHIAITPVPSQGQPLPIGWMQAAAEVGAKADQAYQNRIENAWRPPAVGSESENILRNARLQK